MIKVKTAELIGPELDWAAAKLEGTLCEVKGRGATRFNGVWIKNKDGTGEAYVLRDARFEEQYSHCEDWPLYHNQKIWLPSTLWSQGGPIIEREGITCGPWDTSPAMAHYGIYQTVNSKNPRMVGPSHLVAAMRCYVSSKFGDEVDIPDELI